MKGNNGDRAWHRLADPFRRDVDAGGFSMHCIDRGSGPPVLLVHGFGDSTYCWHRNFEALSDAGFRAIAVDQPRFHVAAIPAAKKSPESSCCPPVFYVNMNVTTKH